MNLSLKNKTLESRVKKLKSKVESLRYDIDKLKKENDRLRDEIEVYKYTMENVENIGNDYRLGIKKAREIEDEYQQALCDLKREKVKYEKQYKQLLKDMKRNI